MLINFSVQNFGSIKDKQTLSFEANNSIHLEDHYVIKAPNNQRLLKLGLIYGANASGKTTVLKAIDFLREIVLKPLREKTKTFDFNPFLFDSDTPFQNTIFSVKFIQNEVCYDYEVELNKRAIVREELYFYDPNKAKVFERKTNLDSEFSEITFGGKIKMSPAQKKALEANTLWNNTVLGGFLKTNLDSKELRDAVDWFKDYLSQMILSKTELDVFITSLINESKVKKDAILQILRKADFHISDILIEKKEREMPEGLLEFIEKQSNASKDEFEKLRKNRKITFIDLKFEHTVNSNRYSLPFKAESEGTQRFYGFAGILALLISNSMMFSIDELESSLHPDLFTHFLLSFLLNSKKSQIIATTHNREILNNKDIFRNDAIWITDKSKTCSTELYSLADFDSSVIRNTSNVYNVYKTGKLGGVPNLGDYYIDIDNEG